MKYVVSQPQAPVGAALQTIKPVHFYCAAPKAKLVELAGDFNHWHPFPMEMLVDGWWFTTVQLGPGHHQYYFLVDGRLTLDPQATGISRNDRNERVSLVAVS